jgi:uncharacterized protein YdeI (YjbR/CyaY-like superfamily)
METKDGIKTYYAKSRKDWRKWLEKNHEKERSVWLILYNKGSGKPTVTYPEAVEEALCYGWIDSKANKRDADSRYQYFTQRNPKSRWSESNRARVERLVKDGLMTPAGQNMVDVAQKSGTWTALGESN